MTTQPLNNYKQRKSRKDMVDKIEWNAKFDVFFDAHEKLKEEGAKLSVYNINE